MNISVITVCWNDKERLVHTLDSILSQSFHEFEFFVIDGGSSDGTAEILSSYEDRFSAAGISFKWVSEKDKGIYDAMNKGVRLSSGDYILFLNSGDEFYSNDVTGLFNDAIIREPFDAYYGDTMMHFYEGKGVFHESEGSAKYPVMPFIHQSVIVRRSLLLKHPFDLSFKICADHEFFYWMRQSGCSFSHEDFIVSNYDAREGLSENNPLKIAYEHDRIYGRDKSSMYWLRKIMLACTKGLIQPIKDFAPRALLNMYFRRKKTHIRWVD